jgi:RND family efflux transporter MFP subunit
VPPRSMRVCKLGERVLARTRTPLRTALIATGIAAAGFAAAGIATAIAFALADKQPAQGSAANAKEQPALTVTVTSLQPATLPARVFANGNIQPWQEAIIGAEVNGLRLADVKVNVGDRVRRGQLLAVFAADAVEAEVAQSHAAVAEAIAALAEAAANAERARALKDSGAMSAQHIHQYVTLERTAQARLVAARAAERLKLLRLSQTQLAAPDEGVISARTATVGAVVPAGQELFRLIRGGRLEWRAEVASAELARLKPGQKVRITLTGGEVIEGRLRMLGPVIDIQTRNGLVYVDLPLNGTARAGMFARGEITLGANEVMTLPQGAVQLREGFHYVMRVGLDSRVILSKVSVGRRIGDRVEIVDGLAAADRVVASGAAFLADRDLVRVVDDAAKTAHRVLP